MIFNGKTIYFDSVPIITGSAGVVGKKEGEGPLGGEFDAVFEDTTMGQDSFELAESAMLHAAIIRALSDAGKSPSDVTFARLTPEEIHYYVSNYSPMDKAGAYGIQEWIGYIGVESINGSFYNVMGLPVQRLYQRLKNNFNLR